MKSFMMKYHFLILALGFSNSLWAETQSQQTYQSSFYIQEAAPVHTGFQSFTDVLSKHLYQVASAVNLLSFSEVRAPWGPTRETYNRTKHFGGWIRGQGQDYCQNTRAVVLIRNSGKKGLKLSSDGCRVEKGAWDDPLTGQKYTYASDVQIDHFVPLKNAYVSNAAQWNFEKRCLYANYLNVSFHLLPVFSRENSVKGDRGPEAYMPANTAYSCQYLQQWLQIKLVWGLRINPDEAAAIQELAQFHQCSMKSFVIDSAAVQKIRQDIVSMQHLCRKSTKL